MMNYVNAEVKRDLAFPIVNIEVVNAYAEYDGAGAEVFQQDES